MAIHHATVKRALSLSIILSEPAEGEFHGQIEGTDRVALGDEPKQTLTAALLLKRFGTEYPLAVEVVDDELRVEYHGNEEANEIATFGMGDFDEDAAFAETLEAWANFLKENPEIEAGLDAEEEEEKEARVVVAKRYKDEYKARGDANHCGDWLAEFLKGQFKFKPEGGKKEVFHYAEFRDMLVLNEVDMSGPWAKLIETKTHGWQGRFRMNGRQVLEVKVIENKGVKLAGDKFVAIPKADYRELLDRHPRIKEDMEIAAEEALHAKPAKK